MTNPATIEDATTDTALRKVGQFFASHISDVSLRAMGTTELRAAIDPTSVALFIRENGGTVAAINSHAPIGFATGAAQIRGDPEPAYRLVLETKLLEHLAVAPRHRGRGHAHALIDEAEQRHRATGETDVWFGFVDDRERAALGLYQHMGFQIAQTPADLPGAANLIRRSHISRVGTWIYKQF
ncbi:GNAT family N-acetyltransferase [Prescottella agglutinans]|uniref:GNAT superfamily N-acetyltransferase n=1 Tax=Prescottella agglutinans TaxID=1644129 RepID=A0ABT6MJK9_9NOCA|nr:GNAT family N-acetyltransferase [Prescottella agglutinans]MDH6284502.1 GNAT superfamily N-acetyltransferase [Prescottella agglutinans]